ncbi:MAG: shikimate kinase, partial [Clostridia bacterium]|nr:shikimate kinase [Clostridia bacterium]
FKGQRLAKPRGRQFADADEYITQISVKSIRQLFDEGESVFRDWESKAIEELSHKKNLVVATGGGAILRDVNVSAMRLSGVIILIERKIEDIIAGVRTDTRPLLKDGAQKLRQIYEQRKDRYYSTCDYVVKSHEYDMYKT